MGFALHQVFGPNVDDVASDGAGRVESEGLVLVDCVRVELAIDGSLINGAGD